MPAPLAIPAVGLLGKLGLGAKLTGALSAAKGMLGIGAAKQLAIPGLAKATTTRMAGQAMAPAADAMFKKGIGNAIFGNMTKQQVGMRLAPDLMFGGLAGVMTPGDIGDKLIAGSTQAIGGGLGGVALGRGAQRLGLGEGAGFMADMAGSIGGDYAGMAVGDTLMRGKDRLGGGSGQTPYERLSAEQQKQLEEQIRQQALAGAGLIPGFQQQYG
jgi:hypothetical protein